MKYDECRKLLKKYDIDEGLLEWSYVGILELRLTDQIRLDYAPFGYEEGLSGFTVGDMEGAVYIEVSWDYMSKAEARDTISSLEECLNGIVDFNSVSDPSLIEKVVRLVGETVKD